MRMMISATKVAIGTVGFLAVAAPALAQTPVAAPPPPPPDTTTEISTVNDQGTSAEAVGDLPRPDFWAGGGVRVTEGTILHPSFAISGAYQTNVFYQDTGDGPDGPIGATVARFSVGASYGTIPRSRLEIESPGGAGDGGRLIFNVDGNLTWNQFFSSDESVTDQSDLGIGLNADFTLNPRGKVSFNVRDAFARNVNPGQSLREDLDRDRNELSATVTFRPGGGAIEAYLGYTFVVDVFESSALLFEDRLSHTAIAGARWQWLPKTQFLLEASFGTVSPSNEDLKSASTPLRVWAGLSSLLTPAFGLVVRGGYGNGFYDTGESVSTYLARVEVRYVIGPTLRTAIGYAHDFADGLIGNFYTDHQFYARAGWQIAERWQLRLAAELRLRSYGGIRDTMDLDLCGDQTCGNFRDDVLTRVDASLEYQVTPWMFAGLAYTLNTDSTDFFVRSAGAEDSGSYVANELIVRLAARF